MRIDEHKRLMDSVAEATGQLNAIAALHESGLHDHAEGIDFRGMVRAVAAELAGAVGRVTLSRGWSAACSFAVARLKQDGYVLMPCDELTGLGDWCWDRIIALKVDRDAGVVRVARGGNDFVVPMEFFAPSGAGTTPDFSAPEIRDHGRTVAFGDYEASADVILYEFDPEYRAAHPRLEPVANP